MSKKTVDFIVLILFLACGSIYSYFTRYLFIGKPLIAATFFIFIPSLYLGFRSKKYWSKIIIATIIFGTLCGFFFEFIMEFNNSYNIVSIIFPRILGVVPIDNILGHMMMTFLTIVFYEHFIDRKKSPNISNNVLIALIPATFIIITLIIVFFLQPNLLKLQFPYFYLGIAAIIPPIFLGITRPKFIKDMIMTAIYFFFLYFIVEIFAVNFNWWIYPGNNYIGKVTLMGLSFPFEELFFWMMFYAASLVSYYELFIDEA